MIRRRRARRDPGRVEPVEVQAFRAVAGPIRVVDTWRTIEFEDCSPGTVELLLLTYAGGERVVRLVQPGVVLRDGDTLSFPGGWWAGEE